MTVFVPHSYQREEIITSIHELDRTGIFASMGSGKTSSTLLALDELSLVEDVFPALVLAPLRVAASTWPAEVRKWENLAHLKVQPVVGTADERRAALRVKADIYCTNYDNLVWLLETVGVEDWPFKTVIADESTRLKSFRLRQGGKRTAALAKVAHSKVRRFVNLTGTPAPNGLIDLWGQNWFLDEGQRLGRTYSAFEQRWFRKGYDGYSLEPMPHAQREIEAAIRDICITVHGLPVDEPIWNDVYVDLPPAARRTYDAMEREMYVELAEGGVEAFNAAARTSKCQQIANGSIIHDTDSGAWAEVHDAKLDALESIIEEAAGMPVLVAYQFKADLARLKKRFKRAVALDANPKTIDRWNAGGIPILLAHPASAGHGLNLQHGSNILAFFSAGWNLEHYEQIIERIGPMRQKQAGLNRPVFVHRIKARRTVDELIYERLVNKRTVQEVLKEALVRRKG